MAVAWLGAGEGCGMAEGGWSFVRYRLDRLDVDVARPASDALAHDFFAPRLYNSGLLKK